MKTVPLKKEQTKKLAEDIEQTLQHVDIERLKDGGYAYSYGYLTSALEKMSKQLKGEFPII